MMKSGLKNYNLFPPAVSWNVPTPAPRDGTESIVIQRRKNNWKAEEILPHCHNPAHSQVLRGMHCGCNVNASVSKLRGKKCNNQWSHLASSPANTNAQQLSGRRKLLACSLALSIAQVSLCPTLNRKNKENKSSHMIHPWKILANKYGQTNLNFLSFSLFYVF